MYLPKHFLETQPARLQQLMYDHPLATVLLAGAEGVNAELVPLLFDPHRGAHGHLLGHVAAGNLLAKADGQQVTVLFHGPNAYVSPGWCPSKAEHHKMVPTWNYAVVEARGRLTTLREPAQLQTILQRLTDRFEADQAQPWRVDDAPADFIAQLHRAIVGFEIELSSLTGKFKLSQNRAPADVAGIITGLQDGGEPNQIATAAWMQQINN